jgi:hypothetical protein
LYNYIGEVDGSAQYKQTTISGVYVSYGEGYSMANRAPLDGASLYIFDEKSKPYVGDVPCIYIEPKDFNMLDDKTGYYTISDGGKDYITVGENRFEVKQVLRLKSGTPRMWHRKVIGV